MNRLGIVIRHIAPIKCLWSYAPCFKIVEIIHVGCTQCLHPTERKRMHLFRTNWANYDPTKGLSDPVEHWVWAVIWAKWYRLQSDTDWWLITCNNISNCFTHQSHAQLTEALGFLHNSCRYIHRNVTPNAVYITKSGNWKLAGMEFIGEWVNKRGSLVKLSMVVMSCTYFRVRLR